MNKLMLATAAVTTLTSGSLMVKEWKEVRIGVEGAYPPFSWTEHSGEVKGFNIDIANALYEEILHRSLHLGTQVGRASLCDQDEVSHRFLNHSQRVAYLLGGALHHRLAGGPLSDPRSDAGGAHGILRNSRNWLIKGPIWAYIYFFRGTPLLVQLFIIYYGAAQWEWLKNSAAWSLFSEAWFCALLAFTLNTAAYTAEIVRGAVHNMPRGQIEAANAFGMTRWQTLTRVILPNSFRRALLAYSNEVIFMLQGSAVAGIITIFDLTGADHQLPLLQSVRGVFDRRAALYAAHLCHRLAV